MARIKVKLQNETSYCNRQLRAFFVWAIRAEGQENRLGTWRLRVSYKRHGKIQLHWDWPSGSAYYYSQTVTLHLPRNSVDGVRVAQVFLHELGHCAGIRHKDMMNCWKRIIPDLPERFTHLQATCVNSD